MATYQKPFGVQCVAQVHVDSRDTTHVISGLVFNFSLVSDHEISWILHHIALCREISLIKFSSYFYNPIKENWENSFYMLPKFGGPYWGTLNGQTPLPVSNTSKKYICVY